MPRVYFQWVEEEEPGPRWSELFERAWPSYRDWFLLEGEEERPDEETCRRALAENMPELVPLWNRLVDLADGEEHAGRMLSLYRPTPFLSGCSQAVWTRDAPLLVRNYDYDPKAFEATVLLSNWHGTRVLASSDCLWGVLDGMNEHGLTVALAFGGRREVGDGFGIPLILRYILEFSSTVTEAAQVLQRVPSHMAYNISLLDADGDHRVAYLTPGGPTEVVEAAVCTNHPRSGAGWPEYARVTRSRERAELLTERLADPATTEAELVASFLTEPLYVDEYRRGYGTLYTATYRPERGSAEFHWPHAVVRQSIEGFREMELVVQLGEEQKGPAAE